MQSRFCNTVIAVFPKSSDAYLVLFYRALEQYGFKCCEELYFTRQWRKSVGPAVAVYHVHWPEIYWRTYQPHVLKVLLRKNVKGAYFLTRKLSKFYEVLGAIRYFWFLCRTKLDNKIIIWTCHNIEPHENPSRLDAIMYKLTARVSDIIIAHGFSSTVSVSARFASRATLLNMPMGNFKGIFPEPDSRDKIFMKYGLRQDLPVISCIGTAREYKGLDIACEAVRPLADGVNFLIAGKPYSTFDVDGLKSRASTMANTICILKFLSDQEISDLLSISDIVLLPYKKITGSAMLLNALTFGASVVTSNLPFFAEVLVHGGLAGTVVKGDSPGEYALAIEKLLQEPRERRRIDALKLADRYDWDQIIKPVAERLSCVIKGKQ